MNRFFWMMGFGLSLGAQASVRQRSFYQYDQNHIDGGGIEAIVHWASTPVAVSMHQFSGCLGAGSTISFDGTETGCAGDAHSLMGDSIAQWFDPLLPGIDTRFGGIVPSLSRVLDGNDKPLAYAYGCETKTDGQADGINNIVFTSKIDSTCASSIRDYDGVIGLTRVRYALTTGGMVEADIQFNDLDYQFVDSGSNDLTLATSRINLRDVAVHELGHFFGLDHSSSRTSTMLFAVSDGMRDTSSDDIAGMWSLYPSSSATLGSLKGSLLLDGKPVFGAVVSVIDARTMKLVSSEMTNLDGAFEFCGLPEGNYVAYANSYRPANSNIHEYYSGFDGYAATDGGLCANPGCVRMNTSIKPSWYSQDGADYGKSMKVFSVSGGTSNKYLNITASSTDTAMNVSWTSSFNSTPPTLELDSPRVMRFRSTDLSYTSTSVSGENDFLVTAQSGDMSFRVAALELYSRLNVTLTLLDLTNSAPAGVTCTSVAAAVSEGKDMQLDCSGLTNGTDYKLRITAASIPCDEVPGNSSSCISSSGEVASTSVPYYVVTAYDPNVSVASMVVSSLDASSRATANYTALPSCSTYTAKLGKSSSKTGCCGTLGGGGIDPGDSMWIAVLMSPLTWVLIAIGVERWLGIRRRRFVTSSS